MSERHHLVNLVREGIGVSEAARTLGISRKTAYKCATTTSATAINSQGDVLAYVYNGGNSVAFVGEPNLSISSLIA